VDDKSKADDLDGPFPCWPRHHHRGVSSLGCRPPVQSGASSRSPAVILWYDMVNSVLHRFVDYGLEVLVRWHLPDSHGERRTQVGSCFSSRPYRVSSPKNRLGSYGCSVSVPMSKPLEVKWGVANCEPFMERLAGERDASWSPDASPLLGSG